MRSGGSYTRGHPHKCVMFAVAGVKHRHIDIVAKEPAVRHCGRIEAAVRRRLAEGKSSLPMSVALPAPSPRDRLRRSRLYLPGNEPKYFVNAGLQPG